MQAPLALSLVLALSTPLGAQGNTWTVAAEFGPGVDAVQIGDAVDLASDGDLIVVQPGTYDPFVVDGKGLTIHGAATIFPDFEDPLHPPALVVSNLAAHQTTTIRGMLFFQFGDVNPGIVVENCSAAVLLEDVFVDFLGAGTALDISDSASVTVTGGLLQVSGLSESTGIDAVNFAALDALRSNVFVYGTEITGAGGHGEIFEPAFVPPSDGAPAVRLQGSTLNIAASRLRGGHGGSAFVNCVPAGDGGAGLIVDGDLGVPSSARIHSTPVDGGSLGSTPLGCGIPNGQAGEDLDIVAGSVEVFPGFGRELSLDSLAAENASLDMIARGVFGDLLVLAIGTELLPGIFLPGANVTLHTLPVHFETVGTPPSPTAIFTLPTPGVPASLGFVTLDVQGLFVGTNGDVVLSGPTRTVLL